MPRNQQGVYGVPLGTKATTNTLIKSDAYNSFIDDLVTDANAARPLTAGGTGASNASDAMVNLKGLRRTGDRMEGGSLSSAVKDHGTLGAVTEEYKYADANTHKVTVNGSHTINPTGLSEGDVMQINILYQSGSIAVSGTTQWELGATLKSNDIAAVDARLVANSSYRIVFEMVGGLRTGVFQ